MKSKCHETLVVVCYILLTLSAQIGWALNLRLSKRMDEGRQPTIIEGRKEPSRYWFVLFS